MQTRPFAFRHIAFNKVFFVGVVLVSVCGMGCNAPSETESSDDGSFYYEHPKSPTPTPAPTPKPDTTSQIFVGQLKANSAVVEEGVPVTFTYSVTNVSKKPQQIAHTTGRGFDISVVIDYLAWDMRSDDAKKPLKEEEAYSIAKRTKSFALAGEKAKAAALAEENKKLRLQGANYSVMAMSSSQINVSPITLPHIPPIKFKPDETKTFTTVWTPAKGSVNPGSTFWAMAYLIGDVEGKRPSSYLRLIAKPPRPPRFR